MVDEDGKPEEQFLLAQSYTDKMRESLDNWTWQNGNRPFVYHSHDTWLAGRAMQNWANANVGAQDLFTKMLTDVYKPIGTSKGFASTLRADNSSSQSSQAQFSHGLWYNANDIARIAKLFNNDLGKVNNVQTLNLAELNKTMQKDATDRGVDVVSPISNQKYNNGMWAKFITRTEMNAAPYNYSYTCDYWVPRMSGYGGIAIAMLPNGATYWYVGDGGQFQTYKAFWQLHKIKPNCT
jgi:hypothetical protein